MAGKDAKVDSKSPDVIKQGFMIKRSQNKKRFTPINYKQRWFILTRRHLVYYDSDSERRKERGRIAVETIHVVETANLGSNHGSGSGNTKIEGSANDSSNNGGSVPSGLPFQIGYREAGQEYTLYLLAAWEQERSEWIHAIRGVCYENPNLSDRYHVGLWSGKRWSCCRLLTRSAEGCNTCSCWSLNVSNAPTCLLRTVTPAVGNNTASNVVPPVDSMTQMIKDVVKLIILNETVICYTFNLGMV